jgi:iron(III) transport system ATP-binding protein
MNVAMELDRVSAGYGGRTVLSDLTLRISSGQILALLGPSGGGKSTVIRLALGFLPPSLGSIALDGQVVSRSGRILVPSEERRISVVFQDLALWPHLSVAGNLQFVLEPLRISRSERAGRVDEILAEVGLAGKAQLYPAELSGGERQRVAIARALTGDPRVILLDEPLANLDVHLKRSLLSTFRLLFRERRSTVLYVTHDLREAAALADRIAILEAGRIVQDGTIGDLRARPATEFVRSLIDDLELTVEACSDANGRPPTAARTP